VRCVEVEAPQAGAIAALPWNTLSGSYVALTAASLAWVSDPYAPCTELSPSKSVIPTT
jgi:hypothetical protein